LETNRRNVWHLYLLRSVHRSELWGAVRNQSQRDCMFIEHRRYYACDSFGVELMTCDFPINIRPFRGLRIPVRRGPSDRYAMTAKQPLLHQFHIHWVPVNNFLFKIAGVASQGRCRSPKAENSILYYGCAAPYRIKKMSMVV